MHHQQALARRQSVPIGFVGLGPVVVLGGERSEAIGVETETACRRTKVASRESRRVRVHHPKDRPIQLVYVVGGKRERVSTGTWDLAAAERQRAELEAEFILGIKRSKKGIPLGPQMPWDDFREQYRSIQLATMTGSSPRHAESRLDIAERILRPRTLGDLCNRESLQELQAAMLAGKQSRKQRPRSPFTVRSHMGSILAALHWAVEQGWLEAVPKIRKPKTAKLKAMKGRPISLEEFERKLEVTTAVVGPYAAPSWRYLLEGLWSSALRLEELMNVSWDVPGTIQPLWQKGRLPVLHIPAAMQKNSTEEQIPLVPWFEELLLQTLPQRRVGWCFNPCSLNTRLGRKASTVRLRHEWVGKVISRIGKRAGVIVAPGNPKDGKPPKFASAHDLRRSCAERMLDAGVPPLVIQQILRHASWETTRRHYAPGNVQKSAGTLRELLVPDEEQGSDTRIEYFDET